MKKRLINWQKVQEITGNANAYEQYVANSKQADEDGAPVEHALANPDTLEYIPNAITRPQQIMGEAVEHLQGRQKDVYFLTMRQGFSMAEAAETLKISKSAVQMYRDRAIKFVMQYCKSEIKKLDD